MYESDHNALVYARQGQVVLEEGGEEEPEWSTLIAGNPPPLGGFQNLRSRMLEFTQLE